ncbi:hypothetical protein GOODEAATRI_026781, partial [Goodea atripinnis]
ISPSPAGRGKHQGKDENTRDNRLPDNNKDAAESPNRSSSFLFDSMYDSPLLDALQPNQLPKPGDEEESVGPWPAASAQQRRRSELLANQEAEEQEADQWGKSFFNLSEWGDSLLVGEHFLERQSLLRHAERTEENQERQQPNKVPVLKSQNESDKKKAGNDQPCNQNDKPSTAKYFDEGRTAQQVDNKTNEENSKLEENYDFEHPHFQTSPKSAFYCSPGLQEIFDRWPSMSDQPGSSNSQTQAAAAATGTTDASECPQPVTQLGRKGGKSQQRDSPQRVQLSERPGSAGDVIPPTQETPPVTPRVKLTTSSVHSPVVTHPLKQSTTSNRLPDCATSHTGNNHLMAGVSFFDSRKQKNTLTAQSLFLPPGSAACPPSPQPKPPSDTESSVSPEGFTLQLSQDASLCCSNSGSFSIIDVASNRRLFATFIKEWKTKERFSIALACEKREHGQQPEDEIGGKHRGLSSSLAPPPLDDALPVRDRLEQVKVCLKGQPTGLKSRTVSVYDIIKVYKRLVLSCGISLEGSYEDPKVCLALLELNGVGFSVEECERQKHVMQAKLSALEAEAYSLAGHSFSLTSADDDVLEKLRSLHPLPGVILEWRRITNALTKVVFPLQREKQYHPILNMNRIYPITQTHTATGRVSFTEPNIQNVPKDFDIYMPTVVGESPPSQGDLQMPNKPGWNDIGSRLLSAGTESAGSPVEGSAPPAGINTFLKQTVKKCLKDGYVQTLMGRRRYLAGITSPNPHVKAHVSKLEI